MGKKGSWFSAIKMVFSHSSRESVADGREKKSSKEKKKKGVGKLKHGGGHSFIPLFREPSSIDKILGEAEREHNIIAYKPLAPQEQPKAAPHVTPPLPPLLRTATLKADASHRASSSLRTYSTPARVLSPLSQQGASPVREATPINVATPSKTPSRFVQPYKPKPTLKDQHICATKIQAAFRGYSARRSYRALRGLVRLQGVVKGQNVKRQTANTLKCMQLMVHVQNQIHSQRIQILENQAQQRLQKNDKDLKSSFRKWNLSENTDEWDDSTLTKEEIDARMQRKVDAIVKRERAMAYAYSHQLWKATPGMAQAALMDIRSGGFSHWWNWLEQRQAPPMRLTNSSQGPAKKTPDFTPPPTRPTTLTPPTRPTTLTPTRPTLGFKASPISPSGNLSQLGHAHGFDNIDTPTPRSTIAAVPSRAKLARTPPGQLQQKFNQGNAANLPFNGAAPFKDDDSLMSCPPFSVPHYMAPTASAKAKVKAANEQVPDSPSSTVESKRRVTFPFGQAMGSLKWKNKESGSQKCSVSGGKNKSVQSVADHLSVDSTISMPATVGRKPFNRFV